MDSYTIWNGKDIFSIKMVGTCEQVKRWINGLVEDFNAPREDDESEYNEELENY